MVKLYDKSTAQYLDRISDKELQFLIDDLEEESLTDTDYYINRTTLVLLKGKEDEWRFCKIDRKRHGRKK